jgi:Flp pilus assembly protein TadD/predicted Ser/Thr protein kinase
MSCPRCGRSAIPGTVRCPACGTSLDGPADLLATDAVDQSGTILIPSHGNLAATHFGTTIGAGTTFGVTTLSGDLTHGPLVGGPLQVGEAFSPRYHIIKVLGVGGMGAVYQAWDAELGVAVALKVIRTDSRRRSVSPDAEKRFKQELLLARQVTHKNVVRIHDLGEISGIKYITMPFIEGDDLAKILRRDGKLAVGRAMRIARQIAGGLEAAHDAGVVHRDLKPANVMINADDLALIMDFGISASNDEAAGGGIVGTLEYMAPEQGTGAPVDGRADIYAFGLILYEMLTGPRDVTATTAEDRMLAMKQRAVAGLPAVRSLDETIPISLDALVTQCLERDPAARFQSTAELVRALHRLNDKGERIPIPARVSKRVLAISALVLSILFAAVYLVGRRAAPATAAAHDPVSVLIADFQNGTGEPAFDHTLEPMMKLALEDAGFISAYDRNGIRRGLGVRPPDQLNERAAQEIAVKQGVGVVLSGDLTRDGNRYAVTVKATQAVTGSVIATASGTAPDKERVLDAALGLARKVRKALGDETSESAQRFATQTFSATSLDVVHAYAAGAEALSRSKFDEALQNFSKSVALDANFGLGWAGMGIASSNMDKQQDAEKYIKEAVRHLDGMTERERYRTRGLFYYLTSDYPSCVKEYSDLIARYAADAPARNNLALCLTHLRQLPKAVNEMREVVRIVPKRALYRTNLALYAAYSSDFKSAEEEVRSMEDPELFSLLALAFSQVGQGQLAEAAKTYETIGKLDAVGASYAASGLGDLALYEGRLSDAALIFAEGADGDLASKDPDRAASKLAALAYTQLLREQKTAAVAAADKALANRNSVKIRFLAARVFIEAGAPAKAQTLAVSLASELQAEPQAYAKIIEGETALKKGDARQAIKELSNANALLETWMGHFDLGRAYLLAGAFTQADSEFDRCLTGRGEALSLFLDEEPTSGFLPPVLYYQGRAREGLHTAGFAESYRAYLAIREQSKEDPLLSEVRRRAGGGTRNNGS